MDDERFGDGVADGDARVERGIGILEDDLQFGAQGAHVVGVEPVEGCAAVGDGAVGMVDQAEDGASECGLAASAFADEAEGFALEDVEREAVDGLERLQRFAEDALLEGVGHVEVAHGDDGCGGVGEGFGLPVAAGAVGAVEELLNGG